MKDVRTRPGDATEICEFNKARGISDPNISTGP